MERPHRLPHDPSRVLGLAAMPSPRAPPTRTSLSTTPLSHFLSSVLQPAAQEAFLAAPWLSVCTDTGPEAAPGTLMGPPGHVSRQLSHCAVTGSPDSST